MTIEEPDQSQPSDHILDWLGDAVSFLPPPFLDPYGSSEIDDLNGCQWWDQVQYLDQDFLNNSTSSVNSTNNITTTTLAINTSPATLNQPPASDSIKKRKVSDEPVPKTSQNHHHKNNSHRNNEVEDGDPGVEQVVATKRTGGNKKNGGNNCNNGNTKEGRWAEQILNPCAMAITSGNLTRVQHHLFVLHELASSSGDANHRLADHGLRALTRHLSSSSSTTSSSVSPVPLITFAGTEPRLFQLSLIKFYEVSPWFAFPNNIANASIIQFLSEKQEKPQKLHILDIGVSHGVQWPTLLEALSRRSGGPPPLIRLTIFSPLAEADESRGPTFSIGPPGDNFSSRLLKYAKSLNINLQINRINNYPLHPLCSQIIGSKPDETLIISAQFRLHYLTHKSPDQRTEFLNSLRSLNPKGVILCENNMDCSCNNCGDFATGFSRRVEYLWRFLDSTSSAFKGRECEERRVMEGEASKALINPGEMNEGKEKWCERMRKAGFVGEVFCEEAIDGGRALLRKYDSNWEMRVEEKDGCVGLWWKGQPVSFCSVWKSDLKVV